MGNGWDQGTDYLWQVMSKICITYINIYEHILGSLGT